MQKKVVLLLLSIIVCFSLFSSAIFAEGYDKFNLVVDNAFIDVNIVVEDFQGILYIPIEPIKEHLGMQLVQQESYTEVYFGGSIFRYDNSSGAATLNGTKLQLDYPLVNRSNTTYMPVLYLTDIMGYRIEVLKDINNIRIITKQEVAFAGEIIDRFIAEKNKAIAIEEKKDVTESTTIIKEIKKEKKKITGERVAYLTFDDGINKTDTPKVLDILSKYNVKATFFIVGSSIEANKDILKRILDEGHSIGNHTYTHKKEIIYSKVEDFKEELKKTNDLIYQVTKKNVKLFRPPYGGTHIRSKEYQDALKDYKIVLWNVDSKDSLSKNVTSDEILKNVKDQVENKKSAIILMHDGGGKAETIKALPGIIEYLQENDFKIKLIDEDTALTYEF